MVQALKAKRHKDVVHHPYKQYFSLADFFRGGEVFLKSGRGVSVSLTCAVGRAYLEGVITLRFLKLCVMLHTFINPILRVEARRLPAATAVAVICCVLVFQSQILSPLHSSWLYDSASLPRPAVGTSAADLFLLQLSRAICSECSQQLLMFCHFCTLQKYTANLLWPSPPFDAADVSYQSEKEFYCISLYRSTDMLCINLFCSKQCLLQGLQ